MDIEISIIESFSCLEAVVPSNLNYRFENINMHDLNRSKFTVCTNENKPKLFEKRFPISFTSLIDGHKILWR